MNLIDGKAISAKCKNETAEEIKALTADGRRAPCLAVILVGEDPSSQVYVRNKKRACEAVGITSLEYLLDEIDSFDENGHLALAGCRYMSLMPNSKYAGNYYCNDKSKFAGGFGEEEFYKTILKNRNK